MESYNRVFKVEKKYAFGRTLHLSDGIQKVQDMVADWNVWHRCGDVHFKPGKEQKAVERIAWLEAQNEHVIARLALTCVVKHESGEFLTMFSSPFCAPVTQAEVSVFVPLAFSSWAKFDVLVNGIRATMLRADGTGACTCRTWARYVICKHFCYLRAQHGFGIPMEFNSQLATAQRVKHGGTKKNQVAGFPGVIPRPVDVVAKARRGTRAGGNTPQSTPDPKRAKSQGGEGEDGPENVGEEVPEEGGDATVVSFVPG